MDKEKKKGILITVAGAACWGLSGCMGQYLFSEKNISAIWLVTLRLTFAGLILVLIGFATKKKDMLLIFKDKNDIKTLIAFSFCGMLLSQTSFFLTIEHSNAGTATVLQSLCTVMILVYLCVKYSKKPTKIEIIAITMAFAGAFLLATGGNIKTLNMSFAALVFGILSALGAMLYSLISVDLMRKYGVYVTVGFGMLTAGIFMIFVTRPWTYHVVYDKETIIGICGVVVIGTVCAYSFFLSGLSKVGAFLGSFIGNLEPVVAMIVSALLLGSIFTFVDIIGTVLILSTVLVLSIKPK